MGKRLWEGVKRFARETDDHFWTRAGPHGSSELAAFFGNGSGFVLYGPGSKHDDGTQKRQQQQAKPEQERGMTM
jgi:hypothetical protein